MKIINNTYNPLIQFTAGKMDLPRGFGRKNTKRDSSGMYFEPSGGNPVSPPSTPPVPVDKPLNEPPDLETTIKYLDSLQNRFRSSASRSIGLYPPRVRERAQKELDGGNPENKTIIDIQKEAYRGVMEVTTLEELKERYPEFKNVLSAEEVRIKGKNSFLNSIDTKGSPHFKNIDEVPLKLIQWYYHDLKSVSEMEKFTSYISNYSKTSTTQSVQTLFQYFNIPSMYSGYLKTLFDIRDGRSKIQATMDTRRKNATTPKEPQAAKLITRRQFAEDSGSEEDKARKEAIRQQRYEVSSKWLKGYFRNENNMQVRSSKNIKEFASDEVIDDTLNGIRLFYAENPDERSKYYGFIEQVHDNENFQTFVKKQVMKYRKETNDTETNPSDLAKKALRIAWCMSPEIRDAMCDFPDYESFEIDNLSWARAFYIDNIKDSFIVLINQKNNA